MPSECAECIQEANHIFVCLVYAGSGAALCMHVSNCILLRQVNIMHGLCKPFMHFACMLGFGLWEVSSRKRPLQKTLVMLGMPAKSAEETARTVAIVQFRQRTKRQAQELSTW